MLKGYIGASDTSARLAVLTNHMEPIKKRLQAAKDLKDQQAMTAAQLEIRGTYRAAGVKLWKIAVPMIQIPLGYGTFRLMRGMAALPVPGLEDGGFLWIKDLTLADPLFVLPVLTSAAFYYTFKVCKPLSQISLEYLVTLFLCVERQRAWNLRYYHGSRNEKLLHIRGTHHVGSVHALLAFMHAAVIFLYIFVLSESSLVSEATLDAGMAPHPTSPQGSNHSQWKFQSLHWNHERLPTPVEGASPGGEGYNQRSDFRHQDHGLAGG